MFINDPTQLFKSLSDQTRLRCLSLLVQQGELCVCELTFALELAQPKISHHLANLRNTGLVSDRKAGLWIYYQLHPELPQWIIAMLNTTIEGIKNNQPYANDTLHLLEMPDRPDNLYRA
jgi:ArsR family transcriptional regulator